MGVTVYVHDLLYVSEFGNKRISVFSTTGEFIKCFGDSDPNVPLKGPHGLAFDENENLYLCDVLNGQLVVF